MLCRTFLLDLHDGLKDLAQAGVLTGQLKALSATQAGHLEGKRRRGGTEDITVFDDV